MIINTLTQMPVLAHEQSMIVFLRHLLTVHNLSTILCTLK